MAQSDLTRVIEPACQKLAQQFGFELVDVELVREGASRYLRIYIDKPDGITLSNCETYHRAVAPLVERVDYDFLEVCSPGLDRPLKKQKDFDKHAGELVGLEDGEIVLRVGDGEMRFKQKEVSLCKPVIVVTEEDIALDDEDEEAAGEQSEEGEASDEQQI